MPRDATDTRTRLLDEAERLFAVRGIDGATTREITEAAGQRNTSALTYHFGSRGRVLHEILRRHGDPLDRQRGELLAEPVEQRPTRELVAALLVPYATCLDTPSGRSYLRIVAQLADQFPVWRLEGERAPHLGRILAALEERVPANPDVASQRVVAMILLMTAAMADRARQLDEGVPVGLDADRFVATLADCIVAGVEAGVGPALTAAPGVQAQSVGGSSSPTSRRA